MASPITNLRQGVAIGDPVNTDASGNPRLAQITATGQVQVLAEISGGSAIDTEADATAAPPSYSEGTSNSLSQNLTGGLRTQAMSGGVDVAIVPASVARLLSAAADTNATVAKASAGQLFKVNGINNNASARYLKIYNLATTPDENDTPIITIVMPGNSGFDLDYHGMVFSAGISYRMTTGVADADTGAITAADILAFNLSYA